MKTSRDELLRETLVRYYWRLVCNGAKALADSARMHPMVVVLCTIAIIYMYRFRDLSYVSDMGNVGHMIAIADTVAMVVLVLMIALAVSIARQSIPGAKKMYENLMRGGVVNASGEAPLLVAREKAPKKSGHLMLTFQIVGVPLEKMKDMSSVIAACIGMYVVDIQDGAAPHTYIIDVVADNALPAMIEWTAERMPTEETKFVLGEAIDGPVYIDVQNDPGILVAGATGSGKSIETKVILAQAILRDYFAIIADYKYVEYSSVWAASAHIVHDDDNLLWTMEHLLERLHDRRDRFAAEGCRNIDDYNALHPDKKLHRIILCIDEASIALTTRVANKETKEKRSRIVDILSEIACTGRFVGICFLIALQRPSAEVLAGELRSNISTKLLGKCDNNLAMLTLDTADAAKLVPQNVPGRFYVNVDGGKLIQGYYFEEHMLRDAPNLTLSVHTFLSKGEGLTVENSNSQNP